MPLILAILILLALLAIYAKLAVFYGEAKRHNEVMEGRTWKEGDEKR
jgi:hypothetical protein